jgi:predicted ATPase
MERGEGFEMNRFVVISGCSGGGKSTLLAELGRRGHAVVEEPGRRIACSRAEGIKAEHCYSVSRDTSLKGLHS